MRRRRFLYALAAGPATGIAGCSTFQLGYGGSSTDDRERQSPIAAGGSRTVGGVELPVPTDELYTALPRDGIPAIVEPEFAPDWNGLDAPPNTNSTLPGDAPVVGVERAERSRAYPLRILDWHEVVNDWFGGPLLVSYCVQCGSAVVAERVAGDTETIFGVSGYLWRDDLVLYDRTTGSLWSQLLATAIRGPSTGEQFTLVPSTITTWDEWQTSYPETKVLLPPPRSNTVRGRDATFDYFEPKYSFDEQHVIGYELSDGELHSKTLVIGIAHGDVSRAYPFAAVRDASVVNDTVGGLPVVVTTTPGNSLAAYERRIDGRVLAFEAADDARMRAGGSTWERATGRAIEGPHEGLKLRPATESGPMFWLGWSNFHPKTTVYGEAGGTDR